MINKTFIIAEAGVNHNGDINIAKKMVDEAVRCGVDAIKFQTFKAEKLVCKKAKKAEYQEINTNNSESQFDMLKKLELSFDEFLALKDYCKKLNIMFLSSPFDLDSIDELEKLEMEIYKIPSGEIENVPYLRKIAKCNKRVILSTGMCNMDDIKFAIKILKEEGVQMISVLHCNTEYPTPMKDVNLKAMLTIKDELKVEVGYSDHTKGIEVPIAAVALGAKIIEKHFTLDKNLDGPDHKASLEPEELKKMVDAIRNIEISLGTGEKIPSESEKKNISIARKSIVASKDIKKGEVFSEDNLTTKRPGEGISPKLWDDVVGERAKRDYIEDELIEL